MHKKVTNFKYNPISICLLINISLETPKLSDLFWGGILKILEKKWKFLGKFFPMHFRLSSKSDASSSIQHPLNISLSHCKYFFSLLQLPLTLPLQVQMVTLLPMLVIMTHASNWLWKVKNCAKGEIVEMV